MSNLSNHILYNDRINYKQHDTIIMTNAIIRNVQYILNTRSSIGIKKFLAEDTILDNLTFGLPDLSFISMSSVTDKKTLIDVIKKAITAFEPRLKSVTIELGGHDTIKREITIKVSAYFNRDNIAVNFVLNLSTLEFLIDERKP